MRILSFFFALVNAGSCGAVIVAIVVLNEAPGSVLRFLRYAQRVGSHIGYKTHGTYVLNVHALIKSLRNGHGTAGSHIQFAGCLLLKSGGDKGCRGTALSVRSANSTYIEGRILDGILHFRYLIGVMQLALFAVHTIVMSGKTFVLTLAAGKRYVHLPIFLGHEGSYLILAVNDHSCCNGLNSAGRKAALYLCPKHGAELITHDSVKYSSCLLGIDQVHIDSSGICNTLGNDLFGYFIKCNAAGLLVRKIQQHLKMPGYSLTFAVRVGCQIDYACLLCSGFELVYLFFPALYGAVIGDEAILYVNTDSAFGQVAEMTHRCSDLIFFPEIFLNGFSLGRRLNDHQRSISFCHTC